MLDIIKREISFFMQGAKKARLQKPSKEGIIRELISNGVAALIAYFVYTMLRGIFKVDNNLKYGLKKTFAPNKIDTMEISERDFNWIMDWVGVPIIFVISIIVFSLVEQIMEHYMRARAKE